MLKNLREQNPEDWNKIEEYLGVIQSRIVEPIEKLKMRQYCTATLLLLFAAIDGLGKLIHDDDKASPSKRIGKFLDYMGEDYNKRKDELLKLRHSLVHNAINVASYMSQADIGGDQHLKQIGAGDFLYVNTFIMYNDFVRAFKRLREEFKGDKQLISRAADRLEWREGGEESFDFPGTPPPPVEFIWAK